MTSTHLMEIIRLLAVIFYQQLHLLTEIAGINIALNRTGTDCDNKQLSNIMFDGDRDLNKFENIKDSVKTSIVQINLGDYFAIHYVIVFAGIGTKAGQLDYFQVAIGDGKSFELCSEYPRSSVISESGMRVNCDISGELNSHVKIMSRKNEGLIISEIEVHSIANYDGGYEIYRGCFKRFGNSAILVSKPLFRSCYRDCRVLDFMFFGIKENSMCFCENNFNENDEIPLETCDMKCDGGVRACGGVNAYSVYVASVRLPSYRGCRNISESILKSKMQDSMTIVKCLYHCEDYSYALLKGGDTCFCLSQDISTSFSQYYSCTKTCNGNPNEFCGGIEYVSVYETCLKLMYESIKCSKLLHCQYDMYGVCIGGCKEGFMGEYCFGRGTTKITSAASTSAASTSAASASAASTSAASTSAASTSAANIRAEISSAKTYISSTEESKALNSTETFHHLSLCRNTNPCENRSNTDCVVQRGIEMCECKSGYMDKNKTCQDIDECIFEPCDTRFSTCTNVDGSYNCTCKPGYRRYTSYDICIVSDPYRAIDMGKAFLKDLNPLVLVLFPMASTFLLAVLMCCHKPKGSSESDVQESTKQQ